MTDDCRKLREFVTEQLEALKRNEISKAEIDQMRRRVIGAAVRSFDHPMDMASSWGRGVLRSMNQFDECELIARLESEDCARIFNNIGNLSVSCVKLAPEH